MSVCLSLWSHIVKNSQNFQYTLPLTVAWSFTDDNAICYVLLLLWITSCLSIMGVANTAYTESDSPGGRTWGEVMMSVTALFLMLKLQAVEVGDAGLLKLLNSM